MKFWVQDLAEFIARHWGDVIALLILYTGIALVVHSGQEKLGEMLISASLLALKLRPNPKNGNGVKANG